MRSSDDLPTVSPGPTGGLHPLSQQQEGLVAMMDRIHGRHGYWLTYAARLIGPVTTHRLVDALAIVAARNSVLRTRFVQRSTALFQHVTPACSPPVTELTDNRAGLGPLFKRATSTDVLAGASPWYLAVLPHSSGCDIGLAVHHLVFDDWSWGLFLAELGTAYLHLDGEPLTEPPVVAYTDYAHWQHQHITGRRYHHHLAHWRRLAAGFPPTGMAFPNAISDPPAAAPAETIAFQVDRSLHERLDDLAEATRATTFVVLTAMFHATLAAHCATPDVLTGVVTSNRRRAELRDVIGFFANGRFLRTNVDPTGTVIDLISRVAHQWAEGHAHQELHLEKTVLDLDVPALVNVKFALQNALNYVPAPDFGDRITIQQLRTPLARSSRRDLNMWLEPTTAGLDGYATYRTDVLTTPDAQRLAALYTEALRHAAEDPSSSLRTIAAEP